MESAILKQLSRSSHWPQVVQAVNTLRSNGFQAVLAGGSVRDALLGLPINDFDIATDAQPKDVEKIFSRTMALGREFGAVKVIVEDELVLDVVTFRKDKEYVDGRHPVGIEFSNMTEDAQRRDFTINALFYDLEKDEVIDTVEGVRDLEQKIVRAVGDAQLRFTEDHLRALRAIRFSVQLDFKIEERTWAAVSGLSSQIVKISGERISEELRKMSRTPRVAAGWDLLRRCGILQVLFPELGERVSDSLWQNSLLPLVRSPGCPLDIALGWFGFVFELEESWLRNYGLRLKFSREENRSVLRVQESLAFLLSEKSTLGERLIILNEPEGPWLLDLWPGAALIKGQSPSVMAHTMERFRDLMDRQGHLPDPWLSGAELMAMGMQPSPRFGQFLKQAYLWQIEGAVNSKPELLAKMQRELKN
jgi:tRNA nucleotidyltransferase/poly(A) polymerase